MYEHTQRAPLYWLLLVPGLLMLASAPLLSGLPVPQAVLIVSGLFMLLLTMAFRHLTIRDEQEHLLIQFGPLPLFRRRLRYGDICGAARGRTTVLDGWGIHLSPRGGWTWNLWGFDCVDVALAGGRMLHIGTDDPEGLAAFLQQRIARA